MELHPFISLNLHKYQLRIKDHNIDMKFRLLKKTTLEDMSIGFLKRTLIVQEITSRIGKWNIIRLKVNTLLRKAS